MRRAWFALDYDAGWTVDHLLDPFAELPATTSDYLVPVKEPTLTQWDSSTILLIGCRRG